MPDMTQTEADRLFADVSKALQDNDSNKLSDLLAQETPEEQEQPIEDTPAEEVEDTPEPEENVEDKEDDNEPAEDAGKEQVTTDDPLAAIKAELEALKKAQQTFSSQAGRMPSIQRKLAEYDKKLAELSQSTSSQTSEKIKPKIDTALKDLEDTDPVLANKLKEALGLALNGVDSEFTAKEIERIKDLRDREYAEYRESQWNHLVSTYPNAPEVFKSKSWESWKKSQPEHILDLATSDNAEAVIMALNMYRDDMIKLHPDLAKPAAEDKKDPVLDERAKKVEEGRKRQQESSANLDTSKSPVRTKQPQDAEALFRQFSETIRKDIRGG